MNINIWSIISIIIGIISIIIMLYLYFRQKGQFKKIPKENAFIKAMEKFRTEIMPFYEVLNKKCFEKDSINPIWAYTTMREKMSLHRKLLNELSMVIPEDQRHRFNIIADNYCPPDESYIENKTGSKYWSDEDKNREIAIRKEIKNTLDKILEFKI